MHYKAPDNSLHFLDDDSFAHLLPEGSVAITDEEAEALRPVTVVDPKDAIRAEIEQLERENLLPRVTREFMLLSFATTAAGMGVDPATNVAYVKVKELDERIAALRAQL